MLSSPKAMVATEGRGGVVRALTAANGDEARPPPRHELILVSGQDLADSQRAPPAHKADVGV